MTSEEYWKKRQLEREQFFREMASKDLSQDIKKYYLSSLSKIQKEIAAFYAQYAKENQLTMQETRRLFRGEEFKLWRMELKDYVKKSKASSEILKELNTLAMRSRITRLEALHARTLMEVADLCEKLNKKENAIQYRAYVAHYYGNTYDIHKEIGLHTPPVAVDSKNVEQILKTAWSGKNYSQRIWNNGKKLEKEIQNTLVEAVHRGSSIQKLSKKLSERMEVGYHNAERLVHTELNYIENRATADAIKDAELDFYKFVATLDHRTTPTCQSLDGQVFSVEEMNQGTNAPPMHARCRSTIIPTLGEGYSSKGNRSAKDAGGKRIKIPADMNYNDWKKVYIDKSQTLEQWQKNNLNKSAYNGNIQKNNAVSASSKSADGKIEWAAKNKDNIMTKDEYRKLRELAESKGIALSGVKNFDGSPSIVSELILTALVLKSKFPAVSDERHKLTLAMEGNMNADDFAITRGRVINFNENAFRDIERLQEEYQKLVDVGWFVKGTDYKAIIHHEFGHVVADVYGIDPMKIACEITGLDKIDTLQFVKKNLSKYAFSFSDGTEIISEVFADMSTDNPSEFSHKFYNKVLEIIGGVKK